METIRATFREKKAQQGSRDLESLNSKESEMRNTKMVRATVCSLIFEPLMNGGREGRRKVGIIGVFPFSNEAPNLNPHFRESRTVQNHLITPLVCRCSF